MNIRIYLVPYTTFIDSKCLAQVNFFLIPNALLIYTPTISVYSRSTQIDSLSLHILSPLSLVIPQSTQPTHASFHPIYSYINLPNLLIPQTTLFIHTSVLSSQSYLFPLSLFTSQSSLPLHPSFHLPYSFLKSYSQLIQHSSQTSDT